MSGRRNPPICCPSCRSGDVMVLRSDTMPSGLTVRSRRCGDCSRRFFTCQEPEYLIARDKVRWWDGHGLWLIEELEQQPEYQEVMARVAAKARPGRKRVRASRAKVTPAPASAAPPSALSAAPSAAIRAPS